MTNIEQFRSAFARFRAVINVSDPEIEARMHPLTLMEIVNSMPPLMHHQWSTDRLLGARVEVDDKMPIGEIRLAYAVTVL